MEWLLKIVDGPMRGAEIALVAGLRVRVGSGADCDIVLADASVPEVAFELDVSTDSVSLVQGEEVRTLVSFEVVDVGTSALAVGPADEPWGALRRADEVRAKGEGERPTDSSSEGGGAETSPEKTGSGAAAAGGDSSAGTEGPSSDRGDVSSSDAAGTPRQRGFAFREHRILVSCCGAIGALLAFVVIVWLLWSRLAACCPWAETARVAVVNVFTTPPPPPEEPRPTLSDIARQYGLVLTNCTVASSDDPLASVTCPLLRGNLARRTERLAIRSLALAENPQVRLDLTDDETLASAAGELLFVVTEGALKVVSASNRVVTLAGYAPSASSLERTIRALDADVKGIERVVTGQVTVGGPRPVVAQVGPDAKPMVFPEAKPVQKAARSRGTKVSPARDYPIAGILTKPFGMVILNSGMRLAEGAQIANVTIERIEADRLILREGATVFEWKP